MSSPKTGPRVYLEDGPHAGETLTVEPAEDGYPPARIVLDAPAERGGPGDRARHSLDTPDAPEASGEPVVYTRQAADHELGVWRYRVIAGRRTA